MAIGINFNSDWNQLMEESVDRSNLTERAKTHGPKMYTQAYVDKLLAEVERELDNSELWRKQLQERHDLTVEVQGKLLAENRALREVADVFHGFCNTLTMSDDGFDRYRAAQDKFKNLASLTAAEVERVKALEKVTEALFHHRECLDKIDELFHGPSEVYEEAQLQLALAWDAVDVALDEYDKNER